VYEVRFNFSPNGKPFSVSIGRDKCPPSMVLENTKGRHVPDLRHSMSLLDDFIHMAETVKPGLEPGRRKFNVVG